MLGGRQQEVVVGVAVPDLEQLGGRAVDLDLLEDLDLVFGRGDEALVGPQVADAQQHGGVDRDPALELLLPREGRRGTDRRHRVRQHCRIGDARKVNEDRRLVAAEQEVGERDAAEPVDSPQSITPGKRPDLHAVPLK
ncbi:hypothetical protein [Thiomonas sp. FB-Cd]|uniref:hypothetical protein n=1 Tax=Thiomonas sp. FB-Cd TaxID=1158292 RepID=UPI00068A1E75|nr:hypothetical protein [Thiomonas sp. FB-Cd]